MYSNCRLCPRECCVDRRTGFGYCRMPEKLYVARASLHMWEEPCISGTNGSGTVFFSGCSLGCVYCQNGDISTGISGKEITVSRLAEIFIELQDKGAHNINLVTPDHYAPHILEALKLSKINGLSIPIVYNTSGYCSVNTLEMFSGIIDIYLTDFKYVSTDISLKYSKAGDYFERADSALKEMFKQVPDAEFDRGMMKKGIIVRHLVLPNNINNSKRVLEYLYETYGDEFYISIMNQYTPCGNLKSFNEINRRVTSAEYRRVLNYAEKLGLENVFIQEQGSSQHEFIPHFNNQGV